MSHLTAAGEITDPGGMASATLARAVGYPGSSIAFAQLLSAMERSGLIERDVRGKRTYRIATTRTAAPQWPAPAAAGLGLDYDELARHLLARVLTRGPADIAAPVGSAGPVGTADPAGPVGTADPASTVARLERNLADVRVRQSRLREENASLLEQIQQAQRSLALLRGRESSPRNVGAG